MQIPTSPCCAATAPSGCCTPITRWMLHADHTYQGHPLHHEIAAVTARGSGAELRLHGCDPDAATTAARANGFIVVAEPADKPHGLREAYLADPDGYVWVPDVPTRD